MNSMLQRAVAQSKRLKGLVLAIAGLILPTILWSIPASAYSAPSYAINSYYVYSDWNEADGSHPIAYVDGADEPKDGSAIVILDFYQQYYSGSDWDVRLPNASGTAQIVETQSWVKTAVSNFIAGWESDHTATLTVAVGTNNETWDGVTGAEVANGSSLWTDAGNDWINNVVLPLVQDGYKDALIDGANDIENYATGADSVLWCNGYNNANPLPLMVDYGDQPQAIDSATWSMQQLYTCAYGDSSDAAMPEVYDETQANYWTPVVNDYSGIAFLGSTSNEGSGVGWSTAWADLNNATNSNGTDDRVDSNAVNFNG